MSKIEGGTRRENWQGMNWCRKDLRLAIYLRDGMACMWCGSAVEDGAQLALDHVVPKSRGGTDTADNLVCSCAKCNSVRQDRPASEFARVAAEYVGGATPDALLRAIRNHTRRQIKSYRKDAKAIIARRGSWRDALADASETPTT